MINSHSNITHHLSGASRGRRQYLSLDIDSGAETFSYPLNSQLEE